MGLFSRKKTLGSFRMDFLSMNEVSVRDSIPDGEGAQYPAAFAYLFAARALGDMPHHGGKAALDEGLERLRREEAADGGSLIGIFSGEEIHFLGSGDTGGMGQWVCEGTLTQDKDGTLDVDARIVNAFGDKLHRACMDTVLESMRARMGAGGGALTAGAREMFEDLAARGCPEGDEACEEARKAAVRTAALAEEVTGSA